MSVCPGFSIDLQNEAKVNVHGGWGPWIDMVHGWGSPMGKQLKERNVGIAIVSQPHTPSSHCIARNRTWLYRLPQSQKTVYIFSKAYRYLCGKRENF
jgi:hypothetical protein